MSKRVLFVTPCLPYPPNSGGDIRVFNIIRHLTSAFEVWLLTYSTSASDKDYARAFREKTGVENVALVAYAGSPKSLRGSLWRHNPYGASYAVDGSFANAFLTTMGKARFDLVHIDHLYMCQYAKNAGESRVVVSLPDIESVKLTQFIGNNDMPLMRMVRHRLQLSFIRKMESSLSSLSDAVIVVSEHDRNIVERVAKGARVFVVENGVDTEYFTPLKRRSDTGTKRMLFMGSMFYHPNIEASIFFVKKVLPLILAKHPNARFVIAGKMPTDEVLSLSSHSAVTVTGTVEDMRQQLEECDVVVVPILNGSGTRIKILEAMASARPVVSTEKGREGLDVEHGKNILISENDSPDDFAKQVVAVLDDSGLARELAANGLEVARRHDWKHLAAKQARIFEGLLG